MSPNTIPKAARANDETRGLALVLKGGPFLAFLLSTRHAGAQRNH